MNVLPLVLQVASISSSLFNHFKKINKQGEVYDFFQQKYSFTANIVYTNLGKVYQSSYHFDYSEELYEGIELAFKRVIEAEDVLDDVREAAGEIYLLVFAETRFKPETWKLHILRVITVDGDKILKDLYEFSRGRGDLYSLKLIKEELKVLLKKSDDRCEIKKRMKRADLI